MYGYAHGMVYSTYIHSRGIEGVLISDFKRKGEGEGQGI